MAAGNFISMAALIEMAMEQDGTGICISSMEGGIRYVNEAFLRLFERNGSAAAVSSLHELSDAFNDILSTLRKSKAPVRRDLSGKTEAGRHRRISCTALCSDVEGGQAAVIVLHDITDYMTLDSDEKWRAIVDSLEDGYYETDTEGNFIVFNNAMCRISEYNQDDITGMNFKQCFTPEDALEVFKKYHEVYVTGVPARIINFTAITKSGRKKKIEGSITLIKDHDGTIRGFRGIIRDITEKNKMEMEILRARKLEAIGILAGGIAHDYNNVLTAIMGNISLAKMEVKSDNTNLMEVLNDAEVASLKAVDLTRRLSTFARGGKPERKVIDYSESLQSVVESVLANYAGTYELAIKDALWQVEVDEFQIGQVISYILRNAMEAMERPGMIRIIAENAVVEKEASHHEISLQPGNYVRISIHDEGSGIPADSIQSIFDPYFTTKEMASGLGLATSYAIIKRHHGYIDVQSIEGKGSTFFVYLPVAH